MANQEFGDDKPPNSQCSDPIAIVGMGCRWPGGVNSPSQLWDLLKDKRDGWVEFDSSRINLDGFYHPNGQRPGSMYTKGAHLLREDPRNFNHAFFGISATEAMSMDPSQRKLLEVIYEAFENAGEPWQKFSGSRTGVFVGNFNNEHQVMQFRDPDHPLPYVVTGGGATILSNRINYVFNLRGPSMVLDTACSASMYALHVAILSIQNGDCDAAVVASGNLILTPDAQLFTTKLGAISPTSRSHTFDAAADGYSRAEGFGALYIKKLSDAVANGDPIRAVVRGTAYNANGKTGGISHPDADGQEAVIRQAYKAAGNLPLSSTGYFECHGTGTPVGDPIEVSALGRVFASVREDDPMLIGSIKPNLGHSEPASALAQIMKAILAMDHRMIPATIGIQTLNPAIDFEKARAKVVTEMTPWPSNRLLRVSINSFGYGGANAHCILDHPSEVLPGYQLRGLSIHAANGLNGSLHPTKNGTNGHTNGKSRNKTNGFHSQGLSLPIEFMQTEQGGVRPYFLIPVSAHDEQALRKSVDILSEIIPKYKLSDLLYTLAVRKSTFPHRAFIVEQNEDLEHGLQMESMTIGKAPISPVQRICLVFTGQGAQWPEMGAQLIHEYSAFRKTIRYLDHVLGQLQERPSWTIEEVLQEPLPISRVHQPEFSQTVCTALQIALISLLEQWGIQATAAVGHSSGEIAAAYATGRLRASEAIVVAYFRGQSVSANRKDGLMVAVGLGLEQVEPFIDGLKSCLKVAAVNSPDSTTISGDSEAIHELAAKLTTQNIFNRILKTGNNAYHSHHMLSLGGSYEERTARGLSDVAALTHQEKSRPFLSWVSSVRPKEEIRTTSPKYWRQNLESPVLFYDAVLRLAKDVPIDLMVEIGPHPALSGPLKQIRSQLEKHGVRLPLCLESLRRDRHDVVSMLNLAGRLYINNANINLVAVNAIERTRDEKLQLCHGSFCVDMPRYIYTYPKKPVYFENRSNKEFRTRKYPHHDLLGTRQPGGSKAHPSWRNVLRIKDLPWLNDHQLIPHAVLPAAAYIAMAIEAARQIHDETTGTNACAIESYKLRNVAINSTMRLEDNAYGVETVLNMEKLVLTNANTKSEWYKFSIGSMPRNSEIWTEHCSGQIRVETRSTSFDQHMRLLEEDPRSRSLDISRWYEKFQEMGLGYGPTFQCLSKLQAHRDSCHAVAEVALDTTDGTIEGGESEYALHPASLDSCLQLALIAFHAGQVENAKTAYVPILLGSISVWVPQASERIGRAVANGNLLGLRSGYAQVQLRTFSGDPLLEIQELKCVMYDGTPRSEDAYRFVREPYWRNVSRVDIDTLSSDTAQTLSPPKALPNSRMDKVDRLCEQVLVDLRRTVVGNEDGKRMHDHNAFYSWVSNWNSHQINGMTADTCESLRKAIVTGFSELDDIPEVRFIKRIYDNIDKIMSGETNSIKTVLESNLLEEFYTSGVTVSGSHAQLQYLVDIQAHKNPQMRILEVGGKTGSAAAAVLDTLGSGTSFKRFQEYVFTDPAQLFVIEAQTKFNGHNGVSFLTLEIEQDLEAQGFQLGSFDLVILSGGVGQAVNFDIALRNISALLKLGGSLLLIEPKRHRLTQELLSRSLAGNWERVYRTLTIPEWHQLLTTSGFSGTKIVLDDYAGEEAISTVIFTTIPTIPTIPSLQLQGAERQRDVYVVYRDYPPPLAPYIEKIMNTKSFRCIYKNLFSHAEIPLGSLVISLADIENSTLLRCGEEYFTAIQAVMAKAATLMWVAANGTVTNPCESAIMKGALRTISTENMQLNVAFMDVYADYIGSFARTAELISYKFRELHLVGPSGAIDRDCVLRGGTIHIERLLPDAPLNMEFRLRNKYEEEAQQCTMDTQGPLKVSYKHPGLLSSLYFEPDSAFLEPLKPGWVQIKTETIGLNMKDLAIATAKFDSDCLSHEAAGVVCQVGPDVTSFREGDRVYGLILGRMGNFMRTPSSLISKIPAGESSVSAASMPVSCLTAIYSLQHIARLQKGESVLVLSAAGSLGIAAIRLAQHIGAEIYVTVGTDDKRDFLVDTFGIPLSHIFQSRDRSCVDDIMRETNGKGIDVILCSAQGDLMHELWRCIAPFGRFIDVGRTDVLGAGQLSLEVFKRNATFSSFDMTVVLDKKPSVIQGLMTELQSLWAGGVLGPIDMITSFEASEIAPAMVFMSKGQHIGKVVVDFTSSTKPINVLRMPSSVTFDSEAVYILVGCLGGLGRSLATWMIGRGAKHLAFLSRSGAESPQAVLFVKEALAMGADPRVFNCDVTDYESLSSTMAIIRGSFPVKGVVHAAMVEGDALFDQLTYSQMQKVLAPKVAGTKNLHEATRGDALDFFLMTSSIVGVIGTPTQSAYAAANAFQDEFARMRLTQGLPATSVDLGLILEIGFVSDSLKFQRMLQRVASYGHSETEFLQLIEGALSQSSLSSAKSSPLSQIDSAALGQVLVGFEPSRFVPYVDSGRTTDLIWYKNARFQAVVQAINDRAGTHSPSAGNATGGGSSLSKRLQAAESPREKAGIAQEAIVVHLAKLLGVSSDDIDPQRAMAHYGLDSLVAAELRNWLIKTFGVEVTALQLLSQTTKAANLAEMAIGETMGQGKDSKGLNGA
ncbi:putative polyketide synthase [Nemania sp. FL0031]|nr:putative polyketide synthase [Nemania sp. FL0031]